MTTLINDLSTTDFLLLSLLLISFIRLMIDIVKLFHPKQIFMTEQNKHNRRRLM
jgi:hypothetical protein